MRNPKFNALLDFMRELHDKKNHDYAADDNPYSNFEGAAALVEGFTDPLDQVFACLIGVKIERLKQLTAGKTPNNETIQDTRRDLAMYAALWASYYEEAPAEPTGFEKAIVGQAIYCTCGMTLTCAMHGPAADARRYAPEFDLD